MDYSELFTWINQLAMVGWLLLIFSPKRWKWVLVTTGILIPSALGIVYGALMLVNFTAVEGGGYGSLEQVSALMKSQPVLVAGWAHYLCFDLVVGTLIAKYADELGIARLIQIPMLLATFMFGPVGLVLFFVCCGANRALKRLNNRTEQGALV
jgi:hypothetical protein